MVDCRVLKARETRVSRGNGESTGIVDSVVRVRLQSICQAGLSLSSKAGRAPGALVRFGNFGCLSYCRVSSQCAVTLVADVRVACSQGWCSGHLVLLVAAESEDAVLAQHILSCCALSATADFNAHVSTTCGVIVERDCGVEGLVLRIEAGGCVVLAAEATRRVGHLWVIARRMRATQLQQCTPEGMLKLELLCCRSVVAVQGRVEGS